MKRIITVDILIRYLVKVKFGELSLIKAALKTFMMNRIVAQLVRMQIAPYKHYVRYNQVHVHYAASVFIHCEGWFPFLEYKKVSPHKGYFNTKDCCSAGIFRFKLIIFFLNQKKQFGYIKMLKLFEWFKTCQ